LAWQFEQPVAIPSRNDADSVERMPCAVWQVTQTGPRVAPPAHSLPCVLVSNWLKIPSWP